MLSVLFCWSVTSPQFVWLKKFNHCKFKGNRDRTVKIDKITGESSQTRLPKLAMD